MMKKSIDLNCDLGEWKTKEGIKLDKAIMPLISSCNIACGGHIGDEYSMKKTIELAHSHGVAIGAHPAYPDKKNFGRVVLEMDSEELEESIRNQLVTFWQLVKESGASLHHIKPHGALYNRAAKDLHTAKAVLKAIKSLLPEKKIYLPAGSVSAKLAKDLGLNVVYEVFADRVYEDDLSLRSRSYPDALLRNKEDVISQLRHFIESEQVYTHSGNLKSIKAETICLHSDTPGAIELAKIINSFLINHGVTISAP